MEECKRVLHVLHSMNCGGAETLIMNIYRNIDRSKIQFDFLVNCFEDMYFESEIKKLGGRIYRMKFLTQISPLLYKHKLIAFFKEHREYRIVHSHLETTTGIILSCAKNAGVAVRIAHSHNIRYTHMGKKYFIENAYKNYCKKKIVPGSTTLFSCSVAAAEWLYGEKSEDAVIIKNGIETDKYVFSMDVRENVRKELCIDAGTKVLGHIGRFYDQKNHMFLIDVFDACEKKNPDSLLLLVGEGELWDKVQEKVVAKKLSQKVKFLGLRNDICRIIQAMDIFLLPSKFEGLPLALVEAQCAGLACYVSDCVPREGDLGCGLVKFLSLGDSAEKWAKSFAEASFERESASDKVAAAGYDIKVTAKMLEDLYVEMLHKAQRGTTSPLSNNGRV